MEREVCGGIGMGNTCKPMAVSFQCMTKFTHTHTQKKKNYKHVLRLFLPQNIYKLKMLKIENKINIEALLLTSYNSVGYLESL